MTSSIANPASASEAAAELTPAAASKKSETTSMNSSLVQSNVGAITRKFSAFQVFNRPEMITGIKGFITIQPLNKSKEAGWFMDFSDLDTCKWNATESDFKSGRLIYDYTHKFGRGDNRTEKRGILFVNPKLQVIMKSTLLIEDKTDRNRIKGSYADLQNEYEADRELPSQDRKYNTRVKYLVHVLKEDNTPAHEKPIVLTLKNLNSVDMDKKFKAYMDHMQKALSIAMGENHPLLRGPQYVGICVFDCKLGFECVGMNDTEVVNIVDYVLPDISTPENAQQSLLDLTIPDTHWERTWEMQEDKALQNYIMAHSEQDAARLNGAYGVAPGVTLLPEHVSQAQSRLPAGRDSYGADKSF